MKIFFCVTNLCWKDDVCGVSVEKALQALFESDVLLFRLVLLKGLFTIFFSIVQISYFG